MADDGVIWPRITIPWICWCQGPAPHGRRVAPAIGLANYEWFEYGNNMSTESIPEAQTLAVVGEYIAIRPGYCGGKPHIAGQRIKVQHITVWHERMGMTPEEIVATYPTLTLSAVHAALAYYYSHRDDIDADIEADRRFAAELQAKTGPSKLQAKLEQRHGADDQVSPG
jgi:uncharacterized protein (DUF433 family)